jgi:hypothetical protein
MYVKTAESGEARENTAIWARTSRGDKDGIKVVVSANAAGAERESALNLFGSRKSELTFMNNNR